MTGSDWSGLIMASNEAVMQWYSMVTQKPLPSQPTSIYTPLPGGGEVRFGAPTNSSLLLIGVLIVVAFMVLKD